MCDLVVSMVTPFAAVTMLSLLMAGRGGGVSVAHVAAQRMRTHLGLLLRMLLLSACVHTLACY